MQEMMNFTTWFLNQLPAFLMSDAIKPLWGLIIVSYIIRIVLDIRRY